MSVVDHGSSLLERSTKEGDSPVYTCGRRRTVGFPRVELLGIAALSGW